MWRTSGRAELELAPEAAPTWDDEGEDWLLCGSPIGPGSLPVGPSSSESVNSITDPSIFNAVCSPFPFALSRSFLPCPLRDVPASVEPLRESERVVWEVSEYWQASGSAMTRERRQDS